jgi:hypothetical protein
MISHLLAQIPDDYLFAFIRDLIGCVFVLGMYSQLYD